MADYFTVRDGKKVTYRPTVQYAHGIYWYGSQLDIHQARKLTSYNNASIQVCAPVLSGIIWALENPDRGLVEADEMDFARNLEICMPFLGPVVGKYGDLDPLQDRGVLFPEDLDKSDPVAVQELPRGVTF